MRYLVTYKTSGIKKLEMTALQTDDLQEAKDCAKDADGAGCNNVKLFDRDTLTNVKFK